MDYDVKLEYYPIEWLYNVPEKNILFAYIWKNKYHHKLNYFHCFDPHKFFFSIIQDGFP